jgi:hypothetical protein
MNADITSLMAMSCTIPAATGIYKFKRIEKKFHPLIYMMLCDVVIETIYALADRFPGMVSFSQLMINIYVLLDFGLFLYLVYINNYLTKKAMQQLVGLAFIMGIINYFYEGTLFKFFPFLLCFVWLVNLIISIDILSRQIMVLQEKLFDNFWFWVSSIFVLYNAFNLLIFGPYFFALTEDPNGKAIGIIHHFVNVACNIFLAVAIFRIPERKPVSSS